MRRLEKNIVSDRELVILRYLQRRNGTTPEESLPELSEISCDTGIKDTDEVLRALYALEGKCLVQPDPEGDFTSNFWKITAVGVKALNLISA